MTAEQSAEKAHTEVEWGIVVDDLGSTDMADSEAEARAWFDAGQGVSLVRVVVTEWPRLPPDSSGDGDPA